jgi:hypothetical protein
MLERIQLKRTGIANHAKIEFVEKLIFAASGLRTAIFSRSNSAATASPNQLRQEIDSAVPLSEVLIASSSSTALADLVPSATPEQNRTEHDNCRHR